MSNYHFSLTILKIGAETEINCAHIVKKKNHRSVSVAWNIEVLRLGNGMIVT